MPIDVRVDPALPKPNPALRLHWPGRSTSCSSTNVLVLLRIDGVPRRLAACFQDAFLGAPRDNDRDPASLRFQREHATETSFTWK